MPSSVSSDRPPPSPGGPRILSGWKNLAPYTPALAGLAALAAAEVVLRIGLPWPMQAVVDYALGDVPAPGWMQALAGSSRRGILLLAVLAGVLLQTLHQVVLMLHSRLHTRTGLQLTRDLRQRLFLHLQALSLRHHSRLPVGDAAYHIQSDAGFLDQLLVRGVLPLAASALTLVVMFGVLFRVDRVLALVSLVIVPLLFLWIRWSARWLRPGAERTHALESRLTARLHESFAAIRLVKSYGREPYEGERFAGVATDAMRARVRLSTREAWFSLVVGDLIVLGTALVLVVGGLRVLDGRLTVGALLVALAYLGFVYGPLAGIASTIATIQQAAASATRVRRAFALATEVDDGHLTPGRLEGRISVESVSFSYDEREVLHDVTFEAAPGELIALVGPSGSGKTTLVSLLPRFFDPSSGTVRIDGRDVRHYRLGSLRQQIAIVQQEVIVLAGSIRDNLRYGRLDASDEAIERAARAAHAHEFIMRQPAGYDTDLAEAGASLSGGERQRLSIARAFLRDAPILILDEPTAALDSVSERLIFSAVEQLRRQRTTFVIAHRLSTVRTADRILVLDGGRIAAQGTHDALLEISPLYRELARQLTDPDRVPCP